jgi:hypothetical protein
VVSGVVEKALAAGALGPGCPAPLTATERAFLDAVKLTRTSLGGLADAQGWYLRRLVPLLMFGCLALAVHAPASADAPAVHAHVHCAVGAAALGTAVVGHLAWRVLKRARDDEQQAAPSAALFSLSALQSGAGSGGDSGDRADAAVLVVSIVALVPVYAWAAALRLLLPGPTFALHRQVLEAGKECYEAVVLNDFLLFM